MGKCPGINGFQTFGTLDHPKLQLDSSFLKGVGVCNLCHVLNMPKLFCTFR